MINDINLLLSAKQAVTVTAPSTNVYDTAGLGVGVAVTNIFGTATVFGEDIGGGGPGAEGSPPQLGVFVNTTFTAGGAATMQVQLQAAVDAGGGAAGTWDTIVGSDAIPVANWTTAQGNNPIVSFTVPKRYPGQGFPRFYRLNYVVATGPMTAGALSASLLTGIDDNPIYPPNF